MTSQSLLKRLVKFAFSGKLFENHQLLLEVETIFCPMYTSL